MIPPKLISSIQLCFCLIFHSFIANNYSLVTSVNIRQHDSDISTQSSNLSRSNYQVGPITVDQSVPNDFSTIPKQEEAERIKPPPNVLTGIVENPIGRQQATNLNSGKADKSKKTNQRKVDEILSSDCFTKRDEILHKLKSFHENKAQQTTKPNNPITTTGLLRLKPRLGFQNETYDAITNSESEHVPQCTTDGRYELIQCHKIGYCWCVNKYGQAIKNSAAPAGEKPNCDVNLYESESNDLLVVTGISANRMKNFLKAPGSSNSVSSPSNNQFDPSAEQGNSNQDSSQMFSQVPENDFDRRVSNSPEPSLALVPNECSLSREKAVERASKHTDDSIWIPECDSGSTKLYAEKQCHKSRICWCVDQNTGLPLRTSEQLTKQTSINCTEIKRIIDIASNFAKNMSSKPQSAFFHKFSESCDAEKRIEFVQILINQFRRQIDEYLKRNPNYSPPESIGLPTSNPYRLSESQVSIWKFATLDQDVDGKLDDREWSKFKVNFKLVDKLGEVYNSHKQDFPFTMTPLNVVRAQRHCWRDFLQFCGNADILTNESITLSKWLSCTEIPSRSNVFTIGDRGRSKFAQAEPSSVTDEQTKAAAITRSKKKNPFLSILMPD